MLRDTAARKLRSVKGDHVRLKAAGWYPALAASQYRVASAAYRTVPLQHVNRALSRDQDHALDAVLVRLPVEVWKTSFSQVKVHVRPYMHVPVSYRNTRIPAHMYMYVGIMLWSRSYVYLSLSLRLGLLHTREYAFS